MESFTLREETKGDSKTIAELVYKTEDDPCLLYTSSKREKIQKKLLTYICKRGITTASHQVSIL